MKNILLTITALMFMSSALAADVRVFHDSAFNWNNSSGDNSTMPKAMQSGSILDAIAKEGECYIPAIVEADCSVVGKRVTTVDSISLGAIILPPVTRLIRDKVLIAPATIVYESVPALYEYVKSNVLISEAKTEWKQGNFTSVQKKVNGITYCLVKTPAVYKDEVTKKLRVKATMRKRTIPAIYAFYDRIAVIEPVRVKIDTKSPARMATVKGCTEKAGHYEWRSVLCSQNATKDVLTSVEQALSRAKLLDKKYVDGVIDSTTEISIRKYQRSKGLTVDGLVSIETVKSLGVKK